MGHSARKKKKRGGAGRKAGKDHAAQLEGDQTALTDELTALAAIFLEDFKVTSESPHTRFSICIRPYSDGMGFGDLNVLAILDVTCFAGYPHKCPKLRIIPEKNLSKEDADRLLSLLVDQRTCKQAFAPLRGEANRDKNWTASAGIKYGGQGAQL